MKNKIEKIEEDYEKAKSNEIESENEDSGKKLYLESTFFEIPNLQTKKRSLYNMSFNENHRGNNYNYNNKAFNIPLEEPGDDLDKSYDNIFTDEVKPKIFYKRNQSDFSVLLSDFNLLVNSSENAINEIYYFISDIGDFNNNKISTRLNKKRKKVELDSNYYVWPHFHRKNDKEIYCFVSKEKFIYTPTLNGICLYCFDKECKALMVFREKLQFDYLGDHSCQEHLTIENIIKILPQLKLIDWISIQTVKKDEQYSPISIK